MLSAVTLSESTLMCRENLIQVTIRLIKHTTFINIGKNEKREDYFRYQIFFSFWEWV